MAHTQRQADSASEVHAVIKGTSWRQLADANCMQREWSALLAHGVRRGLLQVHAFAGSAPRLDVLASSRDGLAGFLDWARAQRGLGGARLLSEASVRPLRTELEFTCALRYIDARATARSVGVSEAAGGAVGSVGCYAQGAPAPRWLERAAVERAVARCAGEASPSAYARVLPPADAEIAWWVERRQVEPPGEDDPVVELAAAGFAPAALHGFVRQQAHAKFIARAPLVSPRAVLAAVDARRAAEPTPWLLSADGRSTDPWGLLVCGLLRVAVGLSIREVCGYVQLSDAAVRTRCQRHAQLAAHSDPYVQRARAVHAGALRVLQPRA